jgi:pyrroloquinoline-quinone synthase
VHEQADIYHTETAAKLIEQQADTPAKQAEVLAVANQAAEALWQFLDGVYAAYCSDIELAAA